MDFSVSNREQGVEMEYIAAPSGNELSRSGTLGTNEGG